MVCTQSFRALEIDVNEFYINLKQKNGSQRTSENEANYSCIAK